MKFKYKFSTKIQYHGRRISSDDRDRIIPVLSFRTAYNQTYVSVYVGFILKEMGLFNVSSKR